jgi:wobble nucleotide-excising tRNase
MKLTKINKIKNFGVFKNFTWKADAKHFSDFNVFYGWNYSGKTTLSRILRCFETKIHHPDYLGAKFELEDDCVGIHSEVLLKSGLSVRVFNSDYVVDNLKWYALKDEIEPILLLGQESIELTNELENEKIDLVSAQQHIDSLIKAKELKIAEMNQALTQKARDIKENLSQTNFTKVHFEPKVKVAADSTAVIELGEKAINTLKSTYQNTEKKNHIDKISFNLPNIELLNREVNKLFDTTVESNVIEKLKGNQILNDWVRTGKSIHKDKNNCEFCGNTLPADLIQKLSEHFSTEYDELMQTLDTHIRKIQGQEINCNIPDSANLYPQLQNNYLEYTDRLKTKIEELNSYLKDVSKQLRIKKQKPFQVVEIENSRTDFSDLEQAKVEVNQIINQHNQQTTGFDKEKKQALEGLIITLKNLPQIIILQNIKLN